MILFRKRTFLILYAAALTGCGSSADQPAVYGESLLIQQKKTSTISQKEKERLTKIVAGFYDTTLGNTGFNGAFLVAKAGNIIFEKYAGSAHLGKQDTILASTPFHIASTTKTFTAMAVLKLVEEGKLQLTDSLQKFFPQFPYPGMTVKMLLSQRSGLPNYGYYLEKIKWNKDVKLTNADVLSTLIEFKPDLQNTPNKRFNYCNTNFVLLALIIEKVSGKSYADYLQQTFFTPLDMKNTKLFSQNDSATATPSYRWNGVEEGFTYLDLTYGDKNIYSTVIDLLKWDQALYGTELFQQSTLDSAFQPYSFEKPGIHNYGLGWRMYTLPNDKKIIYHNGWWHGNNATFYRVISDSITIIILGNKFNRNIYRVKPLIEALTPLRFSYDEAQD